MSAPDFPLRAADQCVKCGLCLPHCPTYRLTLDEGESPRGRIALMQGLATGVLDATATLEGHLDRCLTCRACETVCPAEVPYGRLIDAARNVLAQRDPRRSLPARVMAAVLVRKPLRFFAALGLWLYQRSGLQALIRGSGVLGRGALARLESLLPRVYLPRLPAIKGDAHLHSGTGPRVALFAGCTSPLVEPQTLDAAVTLLAALGCRVEVPATQTCCGAMHQHNGLPVPARECERRNVAAFAGAESVIGVASGCTAQLVEYADAAFAKKSHDIHAYIAAHPALDRLKFRPLDARVLLHTPCTLRNVVGDDGAVRTLLERVPGLQIDAIESDCCGAAGSYFLTQPKMADGLLAPKLRQIDAAKPTYVLSSNVGCAMHFGAGLRRAGSKVEVLHPLRLLAQQLT